MYHVGVGTWPCLFPVTGNEHGQVTKPNFLDGPLGKGKFFARKMILLALLLSMDIDNSTVGCF